MIFYNIYGQNYTENNDEQIKLHDENLKTNLVISNLDFPTGMAFIGDEDFLIIEKNTGLVKRVTDGKEHSKPLMKLDVNSKDERGLLSIDVTESRYNDDIFHDVYLSYVECRNESICENKITRYELDKINNILVNPVELLSIESFPDPSHVGGVLKIGPDSNIYITVGDFHRTDASNKFETHAQNINDGTTVDGRGGILAITSDGFPIYEDGYGVFGNEYPLNLYFAYGIRNSFGIDFDPLTGYLWDTENGPKYGDEINRVEPGFNSGSSKIYGIANENFDYDYIDIQDFNEQNSVNLVALNNNGIYSDPELTWDKTVAPTALTFLHSDQLGKEYEYDLFVATADSGKIYNFDLTSDRRNLYLEDVLHDKIVDSDKEEDSITFAKGFGIITDLDINPYNGYLYVVSSIRGDSGGSIYKIMPK